MQVVKPTITTQSMLVSSNAVEIYSAWNPVTSYNIGDRVLRTSTNRIYERLTTGISATIPELDTVNWLNYSVSNTWGMFDEQVSTITSRDTSLVVTIATGFIDTVGLFNITGNSVNITVRDGLGGSIIYNSDQTTQGDSPQDWYAYFYYDINTQKKQALFTGIPLYGSSHVTITLTGTGTVSIGNVVYGRRSDLGMTQYGCQAGVIDYSGKVTDTFGNATFVKRGYAKRLSAQMLIDNSNLNRIQRTLYDLRATPCMWIGSEAQELEEAVIVYGFYKDFSSTISYFSNSLCSIEIEGLI